MCSITISYSNRFLHSNPPMPLMRYSGIVPAPLSELFPNLLFIFIHHLQQLSSCFNPSFNPTFQRKALHILVPLLINIILHPRSRPGPSSLRRSYLLTLTPFQVRGSGEFMTYHSKRQRPRYPLRRIRCKALGWRGECSEREGLLRF